MSRIGFIEWRASNLALACSRRSRDCRKTDHATQSLGKRSREVNKLITGARRGVVAGLAAAAITVGWSIAPAHSQVTNHDAALTNLVDSFTRAQREFSQSQLAALTTPDYVEVSPTGDVDTRSEMLNLYALDKKRASPDLVISERSTRRQGDTALIMAKLNFEAPDTGGISQSVFLRVSFVARRTGRIWRLASAHYTPLRSQQETAQKHIGGHKMSRISFVELPASDLASARSFYTNAFGLAFTDFGSSYSSMMTGDVDIGLQADPSEASSAPLAVFAVDNLEDALNAVIKAGGVITKPIFAFPGGRRFHFRDPSGNELAVLKAD